MSDGVPTAERCVSLVDARSGDFCACVGDIT
jgi:hypothetical protein